MNLTKKKVLEVKTKKKQLKEEKQKDYEIELEKIRKDNVQMRIEAQHKEKAIFRPSTGFKIEDSNGEETN